MNALRGLTWLLVLQSIGEVLARGLALPLPGPVVGLVLLLFALNCTHMLLSFSTPTPCSPVTVPPMATLVSRMSAPNNSARCS